MRYASFEHASDAFSLASETVLARRGAEGSAKGPADVQTAKVATAKAELEQVHAEANYRVAHAKLIGLIGAE